MAANGGNHDAEAGAKRSVYAELITNALITIAKFVAAFSLGQCGHACRDRPLGKPTRPIRFSCSWGCASPRVLRPGASYGHGKDRSSSVTTK